VRRQYLPDSGGRAFFVVSALAAGWVASACSGSSGTTDPPTPEGCLAANLAPGQHLLFDGSAEVDCVVLPAAGPGVEYEVVATSMARALDFQEMELRIGPVEASASVPLAPPAAVAASRESGPDVRRPSAALLASPEDDDGLAAWRATQAAFDLTLRQLEAPLLPQIRQRAAAATGALFEVPAVGDTLDFGFSCINQVDYQYAPEEVRGVVRNVSSRAVVVEDILAEGAFSSSEYAEIAANFDHPIYDTDVTYFGEPGDIDANGRVILLYSAGVNRMSRSYDEGFIAGFTCPLDLGFSGGNDAEMFYLMVPDPDGDLTPDPIDGIDKDAVLRFTDNTVAHEFQHMINAQTGNGGAQDIWINEGLSHLAEEVVGHALNGVGPGQDLGPDELLGSTERQDVFRKWYLNNWFNLAQYLNSPADTAALLVATDPLDFNTFRMRGSAWMFLRYALDRTEESTAGEAARTRALIQTSFGNSRDAVSDVFGIDFNRLATDWAGMLTAEDRVDVAAGPDLLLTSYRMREIYESSVGALITPPIGGYPLVPAVRNLGSNSVLDAELFTATGLYLTLRATQNADPTEIELVSGAGSALDASIEPRLVILRTR
jgi:hypothetical protein